MSPNTNLPSWVRVEPWVLQLTDRCACCYVGGVYHTTYCCWGGVYLPKGQLESYCVEGGVPKCFLVVTCTIWLRFQFWRRGSDRVAAARLFQGSKPPKIVPQKVHFQKVQTLRNRSQKVHFTSPQTLPIILYASKGCMPSEDLYALKGLVCPQGTCAPWARPCLLYTSPSPRDKRQSRMPSSA